MDSKAARCKLCDGDLREPVLDLGALPPCNRFTSQAQADDHFPLAMAACSDCGLVQLARFPAAADVVPRVSWIHYSEPEAHLDAVLDCLDPAIGTVFGLGPFERPLLTRLAQRDKEIRDIPVMEIAPTESRFPYLETWQSGLRYDRLAFLAKSEGQADLVVLRYLLEHCHDPVAALQAIKPLIAPDGTLLVEVPDSSKFLRRCDYSFIWEEHICYFTAETLAALAARAGYAVTNLSRYEGHLEDALTIQLRPIERPARVVSSSEKNNVFVDYCAHFALSRAAYHDKMAAAQARGARIAICGIGHQAIMFLNALNIQRFIAMMVDDDVDKLGQFAPGSTTPIVSSATLLADTSIDVCLLAVNPRSENKVKEKLRAFTERGGRFYSIFPGGSTPTFAEAS